MSLLRKKLSLKNYGILGEKGAWEVDHGVPVSRGGTNYLRNLWPACIECNRDKSDRGAQSYKRSIQPKEDECFIATAAFFTPMAVEVIELKDFRDGVLLSHPIGRVFVKIYYRTSPPIAKIIRRYPSIARYVKILIRNFLKLYKKCK